MSHETAEYILYVLNDNKQKQIYNLGKEAVKKKKAMAMDSNSRLLDENICQILELTLKMS